VTEQWPPQTIAGAPSEIFDRVAQRFRVQVNREYRHPFLPSLRFDAILKSGRVSFNELADRPLVDILADLTEERVVPYDLNDIMEVYTQSPALFLPHWERGCALPEWCTTPDHWIEPIPPPGYIEHPSMPLERKMPYYKKVPTLHFPGRGQHIVASAKRPDIISRSIFVPVE
ncbi:hypothetical protein BD414DRAFT_389710, partial [Trametes punicea]